MNVFDDIQFYLFNHHHYIDIPQDADSYHSTWVDFPNSLYNPERGHELYQRYTRELLLAEELGFDAIALNEHHNTTYSMMPAVSVRAAYLAALTKRVKMLVAGTPVNLSWPSRVAEEYAMLDVLSGGRMEYGFPLGTGMEYWSNATSINPASSRARFREALDIVFRAWEQNGPTRYDGDFYTYRYLNTWPKPMQRPRPKGYIVGSGSSETVNLAVESGCGYSIVFTPIKNQLRAFENFRSLAEERGRTVGPDDLIFTVIAYVGDTDEEAERECRPHVENFFEWFHRVPPKYLSPPGYVSRDEYLRRASSAALADASRATWDDMVSIGRIACGSADTVADMIAHWAEEAGTSRILVTLQHGDMPEWKAVKNMTKFASEVIPRIRARASTAASAPASTAQQTAVEV
ncbi:MAG: LLM class flavin-dependent oxidoreductase [Pseudonocardiaceae bacterium]|nr:LLM class flavin-dependent oxidoreductase [Pseudonocardiaceae bacterium]